MPTFGPMYQESATVAWVAASNGIYKITNGVMTQVCTNASNWTINGIARLNSDLIFTTLASAGIYYKPTTGLTGDVSTFSAFTFYSDNSIPVKAITSDGTRIYVMNGDSSTPYYEVNTFTNIGGNRGAVLTTPSLHTSLTSNPISMAIRSGTLYINNGDKLYSCTTNSGVTNTLTTLSTAATPGQIAVDVSGSIYSASNNLRQWNGAWTTLSSAPIVSVGMKELTGYAVDTAGAVYTVTASGSSALATVAPVQPTFGPMYQESATVAWVAASDGIYKITNGVMAQVCTNASNYTINGIAISSGNLVFSMSESNTLFYKSTTGLIGDVTAFTALTSGSSSPLTCLTSNGTTLYYFNSSRVVYSLASVTATPTPKTLSTTPPAIVINISYQRELDNKESLFFNTSSGLLYSVDVQQPMVYGPLLNSALVYGRIAIDYNGGVYYANNNLLQHTGATQLVLSSAPIVTIGFFRSTGPNASRGYAVDTAGLVYNVTANVYPAAATVTLISTQPPTTITTPPPTTTQPPTTTTTQPLTTTTTNPVTTLPPAASVQLTNTNTVSDIVTAIGSSSSSTGLPRWASMVVLGGEVASIPSLTRALISRADFDAILAARYGGVVTPAIAYNCQFLSDSVNVPIRR